MTAAYGSNRILLQPVIATGIAVNAFFLATGLWLFGTDGERLSRFLREDAFVEWMQFLTFASLAVLCLFVAYDRLLQGRRLALQVAGLLALAAAFAFAALEEISWFQRVLGWQTPEYFAKHNRQAETNLHNLMIGDINLHKHIMVKLIVAFGVTHNIILPLLAPRYPAIRRWIEDVGFYLPPLRVSLFYLAFVLLAETLVVHHRRGELLELFGAVHYLTTASAAYLVGVNYTMPVFKDVVANHRMSVLLALFLAMLVLIAWILGAMSPAVA